jgi:hypothetical protein
VIVTQSGGDNIRQRRNTGAIALFGSYTWRDVRVSATVQPGGTDVAHLLLRARDAQNGIQFGQYGKSMRLEVVRDGELTAIESHDLPELTYPETLTAEIQGDHFKGWINGKLVAEHTFRAGEIPLEGKAGLQSNHTPTFTDIHSEVYNATPNSAGGHIVLREAKLSTGLCGPQSVLVKLQDSAGLDDIVAGTVQATALVQRPSTRFTVETLHLVQRLSPTEGIWAAPFFSLHEGDHRLEVRLYDRGGRGFEGMQTVAVHAAPGSFTDLGNGERLWDFLDPHPVWRSLVVGADFGRDTRVITNYLWQVDWKAEFAAFRAQTIEPEQTGRPYIGRRIVVDDPAIAVRPHLRTADGQDLWGPVTRRLGASTNLFSIRPTYEVRTPAGKLVWWIRVLNGDPILRVGGSFTPDRDVTLETAYEVNNGYPRIARLGAGDSSRCIVWHPDDRSQGPVFAYAFSRKIAGEESGRYSFHPVTLKAGQNYELPLFACMVVDADTPYADLSRQTRLAKRMADSALAVPEESAAYHDLGADGKTCHLAIERGYHVVPNDWGVTDAPQEIALPWCAGDHVAPSQRGGVASLHTAFGSRSLLFTHDRHALLELPLPDLSGVTPHYEPLRGDWLDRSVACIDYLATLQRPDGTFARYDRMDHYSLGRMTLGLMVAYQGLAARPATQAKIARMVKLALERMLGERELRISDAMHLQKGYSAGAESESWQRGAAYAPFTYHPQWDVYTEMGSFTDQNLGHAHLLYTMLLYGAYVDPHFLQRPTVQERLRELIHFQWASQDWNGDIWRVFLSGTDAAGSGDGYEEDLAMVLPQLAQRAGLGPPWVALANRIAALKFGALRQFDYLPVANEWGYEFLTPMHHPTDWTPESGWNRDYLGDVWFSGPADTAGIYGAWYTANIYRPIPDIWSKMWYGLLEDPRDTIPADGRHWLTIGGYCSEAQLGQPFLGAVKLLRAYDVAKAHDYLTPKTDGEIIWNFAFYPAAMTLNQHELEKIPWMRDAVPIAGAVTSPDSTATPAYAWKTPTGAVVSVAGYRITSPINVTIRVDASRLGLRPGKWHVMGDASRTLLSKQGGALHLVGRPHGSITVRLVADGRSK